MHKGETVEQKLEWKIDDYFEDGERWCLYNGQLSGCSIGRVCKWGDGEFRGSIYRVRNSDTSFGSMKEAAQYVVAEYKAWLARNSAES